VNSATLKPLRELLDVQSGFAFKKENFSESRGVPLIRIRDLESDTTETMYDGPFREDFLVEPGDYLIGMDGEFRCHIWRGPQALLNQRVCRLRNFRPEVEPRYIYYGIQKYLKDIEEHTPFATVKHISGRQIENIVMPVPDLEGQRHAIDVLSRAENIVRMRREAERKAKEIIPALFLDIFGDPATNPKGWGNAPLSTVAEISYGIATKLDSTVTAETGRRILTISNVMVDGELDLSIERYSQAPNRQAASAEVKTGDLLFNWRNGSETHIGKTAIWEHPDSALHVSFLLRLRPDRAKATSLYLWALLNRLRSSGFFLSASRQQVNRKFNASELSALGIPVPPLELQKRFAVNAQELRRHSLVHDRATVTAIRAFQSLQAGVFSEGRAT